MLKKSIVKHLAILIFLVLAGTAYSKTSDVSKASRASAAEPVYVWETHINGYKGISYYAELPSLNRDPYYMYSSFPQNFEAANEVEMAEAVVPEGREFVVYKNYVRPSKRETAEDINYLAPMVPVVSKTTSIGVAPYGFNYYVKKPANYHPIRDFRADYWKNKYYRDEFHNQASYQRSYSFYNYWNSAASEESDESDD
ncbi:MAG: hypothetical protein ABI543_01905 [Ignavibacteria bacterium]